MIAKQANKVLDYPIEPLPQDLLIKLPDITVGQRITAIRETRKLTKSQLRKKANIASSTYVYIEKRGTLPSPKHLFNISKALQVDPILIIKGKSWDKISPNLEDNEKMVLLRLRKGWNQTELATALESFGLKFETDILDAKRSTVAQWERGIAKPMFNKRNIIREVLGNDIFPQESKSTAEAVKRVGAIKKAGVRNEKKVD